MKRKVYVVGVSTTKFYEANKGGDYMDFAKAAVLEALEDALIKYEDIDLAICCSVSGCTNAGQNVLYQVPIHNVNNEGASGSTGLYLGKQLIEGNIADAVLVFGFEKMKLYQKQEYNWRNPLYKHRKMLGQIAKVEPGNVQLQIFGNAALEHMKKFGTTKMHIAKVAAKNHRHGARNTKAQNRIVYNVDEILSSRKVYGPLTKSECCPVSDGAAAAIMMSEDAVNKFGLQSSAIEILGMEMATDTADTFVTKSCMTLAGYDMTVLAAKRLYHATKICPQDINVVELNDNYASNEIISYEGLRLCGNGEAGQFIDDGDNTYGGRVVVNPSGGLISRGHPLGATGLAQCAELVWQLRGEAGNRQVENAELALQHIQALGGATVVACIRKGFLRPTHQ